MEDRFGIVIVTFNRIELLKICMQRVLEQTRQYDDIVIINNHSSDGTEDYLEGLKGKNIHVINMKQNLGGAGGYARGVAEIRKIGCDWVTLIDDDAILNNDYLEQLAVWHDKHEDVSAMAGVVQTDGNNQYLFSRRWIEDKETGMKYEWAVPQSEYNKEFFYCDLASFCGITFRVSLLNTTGIPDQKYFITRDDTEYSMRIRKLSNIAVVTAAVIDHRTKKTSSGVDWKTYYSVRNQISMMKKHYGLRIGLMQTKIAIKKYFSFVKNTRNNSIRKKMIKEGIIHAWIGRMGKNLKYLPGKL